MSPLFVVACRTCGSMCERVSPRARYCGAPCRMTALRRRRARALDLAAAQARALLDGDTETALQLARQTRALLDPAPE